jgi:hypothetical protein
VGDDEDRHMEGRVTPPMVPPRCRTRVYPSPRRRRGRGMRERPQRGGR